MSEFQSAKKLVRLYYAALDGDEAPQDVMAAYCAPELVWRGYHPIGALSGTQAPAEAFWAPLRTAFTQLHRRVDLFIAGHSQSKEPGTWVASMGHLVGMFDAPWLGIAPNGRLTMLRYGAFHRVEGDRIVEETMYFDIPHVMVQAGLRPFPPQTGAEMIQPGPAPHNALHYDDKPAEQGRATLDLIESMLSDLGDWKLGLPLEEELRRTWAENMFWWGPTGIGSTYTIPSYAAQHAGPFRASFRERQFNGHIARIAEGEYGGFFGWPNFSAIHNGGFMGLPGSDKRVDFRVIDFYRRRDDKLVENWVFIDLLHVWASLGVDILARSTALHRPPFFYRQ